MAGCFQVQPAITETDKPLGFNGHPASWPCLSITLSLPRPPVEPAFISAMSRSPRSSRVPPRNGVSPSCVALPAAPVDEAPWRTLADFLVVRFHKVSPETWRARLHAGEVLYEDGTSVAPDALYRSGIRLYY